MKTLTKDNRLISPRATLAGLLVVLSCCWSEFTCASSLPTTTFYDENFQQSEWMHVPAGNNSTNATGRIVPGGIGADAQQTTVVEGYFLSLK